MSDCVISIKEVGHRKPVAHAKRSVYICQRDHQRHRLNRRWFKSKREIKRLTASVWNYMDKDASDTDRTYRRHARRASRRLEPSRGLGLGPDKRDRQRAAQAQQRVLGQACCAGNGPELQRHSRRRKPRQNRRRPCLPRTERTSAQRRWPGWRVPAG